MTNAIQRANVILGVLLAVIMVAGHVPGDGL
jgi:hypothetical protein